MITHRIGDFGGKTRKGENKTRIGSKKLKGVALPPVFFAPFFTALLCVFFALPILLRSCAMNAGGAEEVGYTHFVASISGINIL